MSYQPGSDYTQPSDADDYASLRTYAVALPRAPQALALNVPKSYVPYVVHGGNKNVYVVNTKANYNLLTGTGLDDYNKISAQLWNDNVQPVENITPLPGGQKSLNYANFTDARFNMNKKAY